MSRKTSKRRKDTDEGDPDHIPIGCDDPADMPATIDEILRAGELRPENIHTCVHWTKADAPAGTHERALEELD